MKFKIHFVNELKIKLMNSKGKYIIYNSGRPKRRNQC